jgi:molecular chaperone DnaJ
VIAVTQQVAMADKRDYYDILGVARSAAPDEIKKAYRRLARQYHPDVNHHDADAEERFKEIGEAYEVLSDPQKREVYDRFGHDGMRGAAGGGPGYGDFGMGGMGDIFEAFFGSMSGGGERNDPRGADIGYELDITLEDAAKGLTRTIRINHHVACGTCHGTGSTDGQITTCLLCQGTGQRRQRATSIFGMEVMTTVTCDRCGGSGQVIANPCATCGGNGRVAQAEELSIDVPPGVDTGNRIRLRGKGEAGFRGATAGDLYVIVRVRRHARFQRSGMDLATEVELPVVIAALGGQLKVPLLEGETEMTVPAGTQYGEQFRLRGKGMPGLNSNGRGDLFVQVRVVVPTDLTPRERELLTDFARERGQEADIQKHKGAFQRLKDAAQHLIGGEPHEAG